MTLPLAVLTCVASGDSYDIASLVREHGQVTIGRDDTNTIQVGKNLAQSLERRKTSSLAEDTLKAIMNLPTVSRAHAIIWYDERETGMGFKKGYFIKDISTKGTRIGNEDLPRHEPAFLRDGAEIYLGNHGPMVFKYL